MGSFTLTVHQGVLYMSVDGSTNGRCDRIACGTFLLRPSVGDAAQLDVTNDSPLQPTANWSYDLFTYASNFGSTDFNDASVFYHGFTNTPHRLFGPTDYILVAT